MAKIYRILQTAPLEAIEAGEEAIVAAGTAVRLATQISSNRMATKTTRGKVVDSEDRWLRSNNNSRRLRLRLKRRLLGHNEWLRLSLVMLDYNTALAEFLKNAGGLAGRRAAMFLFYCMIDDVSPVLSLRTFFTTPWSLSLEICHRHHNSPRNFRYYEMLSLCASEPEPDAIIFDFLGSCRHTGSF